MIFMHYPETWYARSKDGNVAYQVVGDGPQDLVFIPSWLSNIDVMWEESIARAFPSPPRDVQPNPLLRQARGGSLRYSVARRVAHS